MLQVRGVAKSRGQDLATEQEQEDWKRISFTVKAGEQRKGLMINIS